MSASITETSIAELVPERAAPSDPAGRLSAVRDLLLRDALVPYLGPGLLALAGSVLPATPEAVAAALHAKAPAPARIRTNMWSVGAVHREPPASQDPAGLHGRHFRRAPSLRARSSGFWPARRSRWSSIPGTTTNSRPR